MMHDAMAALSHTSSLTTTALCCHTPRAGNFTCPLRCGAVFMGCLGAGSPAASQPGSAEGDAAMQEHLAAIAQQPWSKALDDAMTSEDVIHAVQEGKLPKILRHQLLPVGEFIEFEPAPAPGASAGSSGRPPVAMRPVIWFRWVHPAEARGSVSFYQPSRPCCGPSGIGGHGQACSSSLQCACCYSAPVLQQPARCCYLRAATQFFPRVGPALLP